MALPLIPIIMAVAALGSGIVQGISEAKNAKSEAESVVEQLKAQATERSRQAKKLMQQQKTSFLKSGVYFDSGSPLAVIDETYDFMNQDINAMQKDADSKITNLMRQGKTAFFGSLLESAANAGMAYFMGTSGMKALTGTGNSGMLKTKLQTVMQNITGKYKGGFGASTGNALKSANTPTIA